MESLTAMNFTENQQGIAILDKIRLQKDAGRFCDVVFHVQNKEYLAHRNVLAACSSYFDSVLHLKMVGKEHLNVHCGDNKTFELLLNFIYTGKVVIDKDVVAELLDLANQFMIPKLKECCNEYLERSLNVSNCFRTKDLAEKCGLTALAKTAEAFLLANIVNVLSEDEVKRFEFRRVDSFLSNRTLPLTEDAKLCLICQWTVYCVEERACKFTLLLRHVHWENIVERNLVAMIEDEPLLAQSDRCLYHLLQTLHSKQRLPAVYGTRLADLQHDVSNIAGGDKTGDSMNGEVGDRVAACNSTNVDDMLVKVHNDETKLDNSESNSSLACGSADESSENESRDGDDVDEGESCDEELKIADECDSKAIDTLLQTSDECRHKHKGTAAKQTRLKYHIRPQNAAYKMAMRKKLRRACMRVKRGAAKRAQNSSVGDTTADCDDIAVEEATSHSARRSYRRRCDKLSCDECDYVAPSRAKMSQHVSREHRTDAKYACGLCNFVATWNRNYYQHMKTHFVGPPFCCDYAGCGYSSDRIQPLLYHRMIHTNERPYSCTVCNMRFRTKNNLSTHLRCHTGEKPFKCEACGRCFATKGTLEQHSVTHSDHRPYLCESCGFSTKYQSHLIAHKRIHTGDVFRCQCAGCSYTTPKRSQLACHMRSHLSIRSHICSVCGRAFVEKSHLVRHERIHLAEKPFRCELCEYTSSRRDKLKEHTLKYHVDGECDQVFKPRRQRRQTFTPHAFPGVSQQQAETQIQAHIDAQQALMDEARFATDVKPKQYTLLSQPESSVQQGSASTLYGFFINKPSYDVNSAGLSGVPAAPPGDRFVSMVDGRLLSSLQNAANLEATESLMSAAGSAAVLGDGVNVDSQPAGPPLMVDTHGVQPISQQQQTQVMGYGQQSVTHGCTPAPTPPVVIQTNTSQQQHSPQTSVATPQNTVLAYHPSLPSQQQTDLSGLHAFMGMYL